MARTGAEMKAHMHFLMTQPKARKQLASHGRQTILKRHTCVHRVDELLDICAELRVARGGFHGVVPVMPITVLRPVKALDRFAVRNIDPDGIHADNELEDKQLEDKRELEPVRVLKRV